MEARLLNVKAAPPRSVRPCTPEAVLFSWPDSVFVAFDPNSLCALQVDEETAKRMQEGRASAPESADRRAQNAEVAAGDDAPAATSQITGAHGAPRNRQSPIANPPSPSSVVKAVPDGFTGLLFSGMAPDFQPALSAPALSERSESNGPTVNPPLRKLVLNLTHACNLRCKYCFAADYDGAPSGAHGAPVMPLETAFKALSLFDGVTPKPPSSVPSVVRPPLSVAFFGGEPLLAWPTLILTAERIHQLAYARKVPYHLHVTTNGTLIDPFKAAALKRFNFSVLLSLDGPKDIHNASRPTAASVVERAVPSALAVPAGQSSFDLVMSGLDSLNAAGIVPFIRATFSDLPAGLVERLEFFEVLYRQGKISGASIEPAILSEGCSSIPQQPMDLEKLEAEWHEAAAWFVAQAKAGKPFPFFYFRKLLGRLLNCEFHGSECGAGRGYLTVGPDGKIFACHRESGTAIGRLADVAQPPPQVRTAHRAVFDSSARAPWLRNNVAGHPECQSCWARYLCGGGCAQNRVEVGGGLFAPVPHVCAARKAMMKQIFWIAAQLTREEALQACGIFSGRRPA